MPSPTSTTAPPPTSTPDLRVIDAHPESIIATLEDLALNASYSKDYWVEISIPDSLQSATHPDAYAWMEENNFVLGYKISNNAAEAGIPMRITIQLELFRDIVGASSMMLHWTECMSPSIFEMDMMGELEFSDSGYICNFQTERTPGTIGQNYWMPFRFRNVLVHMFVVNEGNPVDLEWLNNLAILQFQKLQSLPLSGEIVGDW